MTSPKLSIWGRQNQLQFLQQVMGHEGNEQSQPNPFPLPQGAFPAPAQPIQPGQVNPNQQNFQQFYDPQFNQQQMMYWQQNTQQPQQQPEA